MASGLKWMLARRTGLRRRACPAYGGGEMVEHFFKSFSDNAQCNLNIKVTGTNEHHMIEALFKSFARALRMAVTRDPDHNELPSTKGTL